MSSGLYENFRHTGSQEYANWEKQKNPRNINDHEDQCSGDVTGGSRCSRLSAVCAALLCVLLLSVIIVLLMKLNDMTRERDQLQISYDNMTAERDKVQAERDGFQRELNDSTQQCTRYFLTTEKKSWNEARQGCSSRGAHLVIINSQEEQEFISKLFKGTEAWIGLTDTAEEGKWKWVDGTALNTGFWWVGEPNNFEGREHCAVTGSKFAKAEVITWADYPCDINVLAICETNSN